MSRRSRDWNENLAEDLRDPVFAQEFILALLDEGFTLQEALAKTVRAYGVNAFAKKVHLPSSNLVRSISARSNPTRKTMELILKPFSLALTAMSRLMLKLEQRVSHQISLSDFHRNVNFRHVAQ